MSGRPSAQRAGERGDAEQRDADREDAAPAEAVAERTADQQQRGEEERIRLDDPLRIGSAVACRSRRIAGSATLTIVPSTNAMLDAEDRRDQDPAPACDGHGEAPLG